MKAGVGQIVSSKLGRDLGRYYVVVDVIDENFSYVSDGKIRRVENPKRKNHKHLVFHNAVDAGLQQALRLKERVSNQQVRKVLATVENAIAEGEEGPAVYGER